MIRRRGERASGGPPRLLHVPPFHARRQTHGSATRACRFLRRSARDGCHCNRRQQYQPEQSPIEGERRTASISWHSDPLVSSCWSFVFTTSAHSRPAASPPGALVAAASIPRAVLLLPLLRSAQGVGLVGLGFEQAAFFDGLIAAADGGEPDQGNHCNQTRGERPRSNGIVVHRSSPLNLLQPTASGRCGWPWWSGSRDCDGSAWSRAVCARPHRCLRGPGPRPWPDYW